MVGVQARPEGPLWDGNWQEWTPTSLVSAGAPVMRPAYAPASQSVESATVRASLQVCELRRLRQPSYVSVVV